MLAFIIAVIVILIICETLSIKYGSTGVGYKVEVSKKLLEENETFQIKSTISNNKRMVVSFVKIREQMPEQIQILGDVSDCIDYQTQIENNEIINRKILSYSSFLKSKSALVRTMNVNCGKRGWYKFTGCSMEIGDFLGFTDNVTYYDTYASAVVVPPFLNNVSIENAIGGFLGDVSVNRFIIDDPIMTLGFNEYTGNEPQKSISWLQSAKMNRMMVKKYDHTSDVDITVLLNVEDATDEEYEKCFSLARTVCQILENKKYKYSFMSNATVNRIYPIKVLDSDCIGKNKFELVLEELGKACYAFCNNFDYIVNELLGKNETGMSYIIIAPQKNDIFNKNVKRLASSSGGKILILSAQEVI